MVEYRVVIISPDNYVHSACFREVAILLVSSFKSNGVYCDFTTNDFAKDRINIVLGYHLLNKYYIQTEIISKNIKYIPYQLEQLSADEFDFSEDIKFILQNGKSVWDYSKENIALLKNNDIEAIYMPIGYRRELDNIKSIEDNKKDIDILFYGSIGKRRQDLLEILSKKYRVKVLFGIYGRKRDDFIARSKIVLNIHHYSSQMLEMVRISYLLSNKIFVISEKSIDNPYDDIGILFVNYDGIIEKCEYYLKNDKLRERSRKTAYVKFKKKFPMELFIKKIIKELN